MRYGPCAQFTSMRRKLWQRLVIWYGLRYNRWPKRCDVPGTSVSLSELNWSTVPIIPNGGDITILPDPDFETSETLDGIKRIRKRLGR